MKFTPTRIPGVVIVEPEVFGDSRGFFLEAWHARKFAEAGIGAKFVQDNHSRSARGVLRGVHLQVEQPQGKLVRAVCGEVFDVAVDLRRDSPHFGQWVGHVLSDANKHQMWIPPGFAHGFYVLSESADITYKVTDFYAPEHERTLAWNDPEVAIAWPLIGGKAPTLTARDQVGLTLAELKAQL